MSDNLPEVIVKPTTDIVERDATAVAEFIEKGMPGLATVQEENVKKMFDMYLAGKNYKQISGIMRTPKPLVMYLSQKLKWFEKREDYIVDLQQNMERRVVEAKLIGQDVMLQFVQAYGKKFSTKMNSYMASGNEDFTKQINLKEFELYLKCLERLQKSIEAPVQKGPLVGINLGEGATVTRTGQNSIEVTPKQKAVGDMLQELADMRRNESKK
jgi:hypothetical protein